mmetsp:Transcript_156/g.173  ORF Transcript_156/g.173 Transcript_156/m.173 type:complete len:408 (+) Transcript_156:58-1281(+)
MAINLLLTAINEGIDNLDKVQQEIDRRIVINQKVVENDKEVLHMLQKIVSIQTNEADPSTERDDIRAEDHSQKAKGKVPLVVNKNSQRLEDVLARAKAIEIQNSSKNDEKKTLKENSNISKELNRFLADSKMLNKTVDKWNRICSHEPWISTDIERRQIDRLKFKQKLSSPSILPNGKPNLESGDGTMNSSKNLNLNRMSLPLVKKLSDELNHLVNVYVNDDQFNKLRNSEHLTVDAYRLKYRLQKLLSLTHMLRDAMCLEGTKIEEDIPQVDKRQKENENVLILDLMKEELPACPPVLYDKHTGRHRHNGQHTILTQSPSNEPLSQYLKKYSEMIELIALTHVRGELGKTLLPHLLATLRDIVGRARKGHQIADLEWQEVLTAWRLAESALEPQRPKTGFFSLPTP